MSAPRKIWAYSMDADEDTHGGWDVYEDDGYGAPQYLYHHDDVVRELVEALEAVRDGYGPNHLSKYARDTAGAALAKIAQEG